MQGEKHCEGARWSNKAKACVSLGMKTFMLCVCFWIVLQSNGRYRVNASIGLFLSAHILKKCRKTLMHQVLLKKEPNKNETLPNMWYLDGWSSGLSLVCSSLISFWFGFLSRFSLASVPRTAGSVIYATCPAPSSRQRALESRRTAFIRWSPEWFPNECKCCPKSA